MRDYKKYFFTLIVLFIFTFPSLLFAQEKVGPRYYYTGQIANGLSIQMDLSQVGNGVRGSYYNDNTGIPIPLLGEVNFEKSTITLTSKTGSRKFEGKFAPINKTLGVDIEGTYSEQDGKIKIPFKLTKVANYDSSMIKQLDKVVTRWSYPLLIARNEAMQRISTKLSERMKPEIEEFQKDAKEAFMEDLITNGYEFDYKYSIEYYSEELLSFTGQVYSYTGGAHGNTYYVSSNYWVQGGDSKLIKLSDLFKSNSDYVQTLSDLIIEDLKSQKATWVLNGEIKSLKKDEIGPFALSPRGIQFAFAPYAVGPYSDGAFFVTIGYRDIYNKIDPKGPLSHFVQFEEPENKKEE